MPHENLGSYKDTLKHIPFRNIKDLEKKLEQIKHVQTLISQQLKHFFFTHNISFTEIDDGTLFVDNGIPEPLVQEFQNLIEAQKQTVADIYKQTGIVSTEIPADYDKKLYSGLIEIITSRSN